MQSISELGTLVSLRLDSLAILTLWRRSSSLLPLADPYRWLFPALGDSLY